MAKLMWKIIVACFFSGTRCSFEKYKPKAYADMHGDSIGEGRHVGY